jgi:hypothetical protein
MKELYYFLSLLFLIVLWYIAWQDWKSKLIAVWSFYLLNIAWLVWLFFVDVWYAKYIMWIYFLWIIVLEFIDYLWKLPKCITKDWMIWWTGIYDYWLYLFIIVLFIDYLPNNFLWFYIWFTLSLAGWALIAYLLTKKRYDKHIPLFVYWFFILLWMIITIFILR